MTKIIRTIDRSTSYFYHFSIFALFVAIFQVIAFFTYQHPAWILTGYFWYAFLFVGLIDAIIFLKRKMKGSWKESFSSTFTSVE